MTWKHSNPRRELVGDAVFGLLWLGIVASAVVAEYPWERTWSNLFWGILIGVFALLPVFGATGTISSITLNEHDECHFRTVLGRTSVVRVHQIRSIRLDEGSILIVHDHGRVEISDDAFVGALARLIELNASIRVDDSVRRTIQRHTVG